MEYTCVKCKRTLPEDKFYPSTIRKGWYCCKECQNQITYKNAKLERAYNRKVKALVEEAAEKNQMEEFDRLYGGYTLMILNTTNPGEFKYTINGTNKDFFRTNSSKDFLNKVSEIIHGRNGENRG